MKIPILIPALALTASLCLSTVSAPAETAGWYGDHRVVSGDNLWNISKTDLGDPLLWPLIYNANRPMIRNPERIAPGLSLSLPLNPSEAELEAALQTARLYKEALPVPAMAPALEMQLITLASMQPVPAVETKASKPMTRFIKEDLITLVFAFYMLAIALGVGLLSLLYMRADPHHESEHFSAHGVELKPWASINEISGMAEPVMEEEAWREAA